MSVLLFSVIGIGLILGALNVVLGAVGYAVGYGLVSTGLWQVVVLAFALLVIYVGWIASFTTAVACLETFGLRLQGRAVFLCFPIAPLVALALGLPAALSHLGRNSGARGPLVAFGVVTLACVAALVVRLVAAR